VGGASNWRVVDLSDREVSGEILEACRLGDREAFRALYGVYKDRVYSIALYFFHGDHAVAGDVTQQVFLKLMTSIGRFRGEAAFSTWLYRLVVNACLDITRRRASDALILAASPHETAGGPGAQEEAYARADQKQMMREHLRL